MWHVLKGYNTDITGVYLAPVVRRGRHGKGISWLGYAYTAVQNQNAVSAYFTSEQILPFGFAEQ